MPTGRKPPSLSSGYFSRILHEKSCASRLLLFHKNTHESILTTQLTLKNRDAERMFMEDDNGTRCPALTVAVFAKENCIFNAADIVDAAWFRGDMVPFWRIFLAGVACEHQAAEDGSEADSDALQALSEDVRYNHDLITAEETEMWLMSHGLTLDDLNEYSSRLYWSRQAIAPPQAEAIHYPDAAADIRELFLKDLFFGGAFEQLASLLSWRAACQAEPDPPDLAGRLEAERSQFVQRTGSAPGQLAGWLRQLGRDEQWFENLAAQEAVYRWNCDRLRTPENRARVLATLRLPLTRFEIEMLDLETADAAHEACLCLDFDGLSMQDLAAQEHYRVEKLAVFLEDFPEALKQRLLSAKKGLVLDMTTSDDRFQVCRIIDKKEPTLTDNKVLARVDAELVAGHFGNLVSNHITWLLQPDSSA